MIYLIYNEELNRTKVGYTMIPPAHRLANLQSGASSPLEYLGGLPGTRADERAIHRALRRRHVFGEWYEHDEETAELQLIGATYYPLMSDPTFDPSARGYELLPAARVHEIADECGLDERGLVEWIRDGKLAAGRLAAADEATAERLLSIDPTDLYEFLAENRFFGSDRVREGVDRIMARAKIGAASLRQLVTDPDLCSNPVRPAPAVC